VLITNKKKKKINLDKIIIYPTYFLIKNFTPPKYFPTISPILKDVSKIKLEKINNIIIHPPTLINVFNIKGLFQCDPGKH